jgi:hypothetical protein
MADVRSKTGAATVSDFSGSTGTPIVVNQTNGDLAVLKTGDVIQIISPAGSSTQVFSAAPATAAENVVRLDQSYIANDFRLSLTSGLPVTTSDVTAATTIYLTPKIGNKIGLWNGSIFVNYASAEMSLAIGTLASATIPQDIFCYLNSGVPTLEKLAWTSTTARATALAYQSGVLVKSGDATRRYIGSFCPTSTTTTEDSLANRYLWNYYHRSLRTMIRHDTTASWTYATLTWRQANASTANKLNFFIGYVEDNVTASLNCAAGSSASGNVMLAALALNSITVPGGEFQRTISAVTGVSEGLSASINTMPALGLNYIAWLENAQATATYYGWDAVLTGSGISGHVMS